MNQDKDVRDSVKSIWATRIFWCIVLPTFVGVAVVVPLMKLEASQKERREAAEHLAKATEQQLRAIGTLSADGKQMSDLAAGVDNQNNVSGGHEPDHSAVLAEMIRKELDDSTGRQGLDWRCIKVQLAKCEANTYLGIAEFDSTEPLAFKVKVDAAHQAFGFCSLRTSEEWERKYENARENKPNSRDADATEGYAESLLELQSWRWHREYGSYLVAEGAVKNVSDTRLEDVEAVVVFMNENGDLVTSETSGIEYDPILPGQVSPFSVMARANPAIVQASIDFKKFSGGSIKWKMRDSMLKPDAIKTEDTAESAFWEESVEQEKLLSDEDTEKLRSCPITYCTNVRLVTTGICFGEFLDGLSHSASASPILTKSNDGRTVLTLGQGAKVLKLFFACDPSRGVCTIVGGESEGQEFDWRTALSVMIGLTGQ